MFINGVFVKAFNQLNLKLFRDFDLIIILQWFFSVEFFDLLYLVLVLDFIYRVQLPIQYQISVRIFGKDRVCFDRQFLLIIQLAAKGVGLTVLITLIVDNNEIEFGQEFYLIDLSFIKFFLSRERYKVLIISVHLNLVVSTT